MGSVLESVLEMYGPYSTVESTKSVGSESISVRQNETL